MAYLLQTNEHREMRHLSGYAQPGDVVVSDDFRAVYTIAKDGSRFQSGLGRLPFATSAPSARSSSTL